ncbi:hypothetical protein BGZ70_005086 [Mortierella alpina]|uniref:Uncharacterized protein n=1 Tax=Mortierella alpina TaxID=64518 RepID=A0A9P6J977_MORAP|nr:hypothetical protein BGZ70_005086 [Mortierella alpina]
MEDSRASHHPYNSSNNGSQSHGSERYSGPSSSSQQQRQQQQLPHPSYSKETRAHPQSREQSYSQDLEAGAAWRSPITPTTTRKFNRMAIHEVLDSHQHSQHPYGNEDDSPPYRRRGSPEEYSFSDPPVSSSGGMSNSGPGSQHQSRQNTRGDMRQYSDRQRAHSPRYRQESPMPGSNSEDEDDDIRNYKKRRMVPGMSQAQRGSAHQHSPPSTSPGPQPEVMDQVRSTLKLKQQQKAIIESRQNAHQQGGHGQQQPSSQHQQHQAPSSSSHQSSAGRPGSSNGNSQPVTETTASGVSVFHGSASFASRPQPSPKNPKNAKSLTIFAPSYSESSLSIHSAPLQPSQSHQAMSMGLRTSQPLLPRHQHHPYAPHAGSYQQPLRSPRTAGHAKKSSRATLRQPGADNGSGTLPAPILSSHTGPLPSPSMYPSTPFHSNPKHMFMDTVSNLFDSVDSSRSLKYTLEEQIRKSAQLLQTLQASGTMIENLVRGQFKELEKGVIERFESDIEHLTARVRQLEEHQGLTPPPKVVKAVAPAPLSVATSTPPTSTSSSSAMTGVATSSTGVGAGAGSAAAATAGSATVEVSMVTEPSPASAPRSGSAPSDGTLPTPPLTKSQDTASAMEIEDEEEAAKGSRAYNSTVKNLQERVADLEKR